MTEEKLDHLKQKLQWVKDELWESRLAFLRLWESIDQDNLKPWGYWLERYSWLGTLDPAHDPDDLPSRRRILTDDEIRQIWKEVDTLVADLDLCDPAD